MNGVLNLYKPKGISSAKAVSITRAVLKQKAAGHFGTLDPAAEGVLLIGVGKATRLFDFFLQKDKRYTAEFTFGAQTDTLDGEGIVTQTTPLIPEANQIRTALSSFKGKILQTPPKFSAKHINGKRAYELARAGGEFELAAKEVEVYSIELVCQSAPNIFTFDISCSAGTYIRSLARDIAEKCQSLAFMSKLTRTDAGSFNMASSVSFEDLERLGERALIPVTEALGALPRVNIEERYYNALCSGVKIYPDINIADNFALYCKNQLFGIAHINAEGAVKIKTYLKD